MKELCTPLHYASLPLYVLAMPLVSSVVTRQDRAYPPKIVYCCCYHTVTGEANFSMKATSLVVGGFNQPLVACSLIELPGNAEKGLSQRFLWLFPVYGTFETLEPVNEESIDNR